MTLVLIFIFGLIIGSFLNAVIFRLHSGESVLFNRSHCQHCNHELAAIDLIPLFSFIFLRGKCRYCSRKISWQYFIVELLTAALFGLLAIQSRFQIQDSRFIFSIIFASFFIVIAVFDFKHYLILDKVVFPALAIAVIYRIITGHFLDGVWAALIVSGFFAIQYYISKGRWIGFGDVKFGLLLGMLFGIKLSVVMLLGAYFSGALIGLGLVVFGQKKMSSQLPFGVFLSFSAIIILLYGQQIGDWYFKLIGL